MTNIKTPHGMAPCGAAPDAVNLPNELLDLLDALETIGKVYESVVSTSTVSIPALN